MKRTLKFLGFGLMVTAVLALAIGGTALAADRDRTQLRTDDCETCTCDGQPLRDGSCSNCSGDQLRLGNGEGNKYLGPGPHGNGKCSAK
jgi:hypothetical protein